MAYKVFFVEDELVTREGIRDNVDWRGCGFEFSGEATDGEMALPLLRALKPDVLITDIKMPFMDGLQLSKIVRQHMPGVKIVILSGHDEFDYAQEAISVGVTEYLLKPVTVRKLQDTLRKLAAQLDQERIEQEKLQQMQHQMEENRSLLQERLLLKLLLGAVPPGEAIEQGQLLGMDLVARNYQVLILRMDLKDRSEQFEYEDYQQAQNLFISVVENDPDVFVIIKDFENFIVIRKGSAPQFLEEQREVLLERFGKEICSTRFQFSAGIGCICQRIAEINRSFIEALVNVQQRQADSASGIGQTALIGVDRSAVENYLRCGNPSDFDRFFAEQLLTVGESALKSDLIKNYILVDLVLITTRLVVEMGGDIEQVVPEIKIIEIMLANIRNMEQLREQVRNIVVEFFAFREKNTLPQHRNLVWRAKEFIEQHYNDPELSLNQVAALVNLSASYFSEVFSQETCQTFKEYLTEIRIMKARQLLRTTSLRTAEIAFQVGYNDAHYFSSAFKKQTGLSPTEYRSHADEA